MGLMSWIVVLLAIFEIVYLALFSRKAYNLEKSVNSLFNFLMKERESSGRHDRANRKIN